LNLEEARNLKAQIKSTILVPFLVTAGMVETDVGLASPGTIAIGIYNDTGATDAFKIALRIQDPRLIGHPIVTAISEAAGGEVNVAFIGRVGSRTTAKAYPRVRPLTIGCSIGASSGPGGTLGAFVYDASGNTLILSNNHVVARSNAAGIGESIVQQAIGDGGTTADAVATLEAFESLTATGNVVDAAVAKVTAGIGVDATLPAGLKLGAPASAWGERVTMYGRSTKGRVGVAQSKELDNLVVELAGRRYEFEDQIEIVGETLQPFGIGGDSGALVLNLKGNPVGLFFAYQTAPGADGKQHGYANQITTVLSKLSVSF
jgi:hypothetical protein